MKYNKYHNTVDSGYGTTIPEHWSSYRMKFCVTYNDDVLPDNTDPDTLISYIDISNVDLLKGVKSIDVMPFEKAPSRARRIVQDGDTIVSTVRTYLKAIAKIDHPVDGQVVSTGFAVLRASKVINPDFLSYFVKGQYFVEEVCARSYGVSYPAINPSELVCIPCFFPVDLNEQLYIVKFLDWKTAQLDKIVNSKKELISKLEAQRASTIMRAITRGINSLAPTKNTEVEWLGPIPTNWNLKRLRFLSSSIEQGWSPQCDNYQADLDSWGVLKVGCVNGKTLNVAENKALPSTLEPKVEYEIKPGDILISRANTRELLGSAAIVPEGVRSKLILCDKLYRLTLEEEIDPEYLLYVLRSPISRFQYEREATGTSGSMQNIGQDTIKNLLVTVPNKEEQKAIVKYLKDEIKKIDSMIDTTKAAVSRIIDYRSSLISSAVTGQIDVRELDIPEEY